MQTPNVNNSLTVEPGRVAWYVTGRFYTDQKSRSFDVGYFPKIKGIEGNFFDCDTPDESSAWFTFYADKFTGTSIVNGDVSMGIYPPGEWHMYLADKPGGDFDDPSSFRQGTKIATFAREGVTGGMAIGAYSVSLLTFKLLESVDFSFQGQVYNLKDIFPLGVTQTGFGSGSLQPGLPSYSTIKCFAATAITVGKDG
ncbi:MAG: hypothetical protein ACRBHB_02895 [Arenicella sp.]